MDEKLMTIDVTCRPALSVKGKTMEIVMIPFTAAASGAYFTGTVEGEGVDTQTITCGEARLSARYLLKGTDARGQACRVFIENNGSRREGFTPHLVSDSPLLQAFEDKELYATVEPAPEGVSIGVYCRKEE